MDSLKQSARSKRRGKRMDGESVAIELPEIQGHPNRIPFSGCLTLIDVASDRAPSGARGHRVVLTRNAAVKALPGLMGMAVDFKDGWDGHDARQKCGIISAAWIEGNRVQVEGFIFGKDYPEIESAQDKHLLGMSYELADAHVADMRADVWTLTRATFTGAAILQVEKAAYQRTSFRMLKPLKPSSSPRLGILCAAI